ncbi:MAG TPA: PilN domain-containing protein, partial [Dongiaceae bacterium]|nr:PilN domain-containing protein [Dongiaceae bacterium]
LPPKISAWQKFSTQYASGKLRTAGLAAAVLLLLVFGAFLYQQILLMRLRAEWKQMETGVTELNTTQQQILQYRPWYDETVRGLTILQELTTAFPEDGVVTVKTLEIRDLNTITCTGTARDNSSLQKTLDRLRKQAGVTGVSLGQIRGKSPMQFTFNFQWSEGGQNAN